MNDMGNLSGCMVEGSAGEVGGGRKLRGKALVTSVCLQVAGVAGLLLWPLITLGVLPAQLVFTPLPPYHAVKASQPPPPHMATHPPSLHNVAESLHQPPMIPTRIVETGGSPLSDEYLRGNPGDALPTGLLGGNETTILRRPDAAPANSAPKRISMGLMDAQLIERVQPEYPTIAKAIHLSGTVVLRAIIGTDGRVRQLQVVTGNPMLAEAARAAVLQWRYRPTQLNGAPVEVETQITVNFVLE